MIVHVDMGVGNLGSLLRAFERLGTPLVAAKRPADLENAAAIILPGVGAFGDGMASLRAQGFAEPLRRLALSGTPLFGICLGLQLMANTGSEHGDHQGLGVIRGHVRRLEATDRSARVPNIGWCDVQPTRASVLFPTGAPAIYYHVHSYFVDGADPATVAAAIDFGGATIPVAIEAGACFGVQFHPEKSQDDGLGVLTAFLDYLRRFGRLS